MTSFAGTVALEDDNVPVTVGLHDDKISLISGDVSIGEWQAGEYLVIDLGEGTFVIEAEQSSLAFHPDDPGGFARSIGQETLPQETSAQTMPSDTVVIVESPPPRPATVAAFYTLVAVTLALGAWALLALL
jgi:hypothetical protein